MVQEIFQSRWFALLALLCAAASGFLWYIDGSAGWIALIFGGVPLLLLYAFRQENPVPNVVTALFAVFLLTAAVGVWAAYDPQAAVAKFWVIMGSLLIFYALAAQPFKNLTTIFWGISLLGLSLAVYLLLTHNWVEVPADIDLINQIGLTWTGVRPELNFRLPSDNIADGILAVLVIFPIATTIRAVRRRRIGSFLLAGAITLAVLVALLLTSSPSAWGALVIGLAIWAWWPLSQRLHLTFGVSSARLFQRSLLIGCLVAVSLVMLFPHQIFALARAVPGESSAVSRAGLYVNAVKLVPDFWLTGGGLQSFAGLYSQYILDIPFLYFEYGHNLYLDVILEQGIFGLAALLGIFTFAMIWLLRGFISLERRSRTRRIYLPAVFAALIILLVHGLLDNPFYGETATPLLFILPGLAISVTNSRDPARNRSFSILASLQKIPGAKYWASGLVVLMIGLLLTFYRPAAAILLGNYSAVEMARIQLADFPRESWVDLPMAEKLQPVEPHLLQTLWYNPSQRAANYRLGLIHMYRRDYDQAVPYLLTAYEQDPAHRGVRKALGYSYVWLGKFEQAYDKLSVLPEAGREMTDYIDWWQKQDRPDLAGNARRMVRMMNDRTLP